MRRACTLVLLLLVTTTSSAPAWALALADHSCCSASHVAVGSAAHSHGKVAAKHAHCAGMAARSAQPLPTGSTAMSALHRACACALGTMQSPRNAATLAVAAQIAAPISYQITAAKSQLQTLRGAILRDERGPPTFLL